MLNKEMIARAVCAIESHILNTGNHIGHVGLLNNQGECTMVIVYAEGDVCQSLIEVVNQLSEIPRFQEDT